MPGRHRPLSDRFLRSLVQWRLLTGVDADLSEDEAIHRVRGLTRRELLGLAAVGGASLGLAACTGAPTPRSTPTQSARSTSPDAPSVVVVGAGLAGLTAAYRLGQAGVPARVHEARDRIGGRCWSSTGWAGGQIAEHGGEFVDTRHVHLIGLIEELGLTLGDTWAGYDPDSVSFTWVDGAAVRRGTLLGPVNRASKLLARTAKKNGSYFAGRAGPRAIAFDEMTQADWFEQATGESIESPMGRVFSAVQADDFGLDADELSATNLIDYYAVGWHGSDERYTVDGGNSQVAQGLLDRLPEGSVTLNSALQSLRRTPGGTYELTFSDTAAPVVADYVVLTVPFTALQDVDLTGAGLSARKLAAIQQLGMGTNSKLLLQLDRPYAELGRWSSYLQHADTPRFSTWESSNTDAGSASTSLITVYTGGRAGSTYPTDQAHGTAPAEVTEATLAAMEQMLPGISAARIGDAWLDNWADDPWVRGSYAAFRPGNVTAFWGLTGQAEGRVHFAGEHTSVFSQGYLNGGVESGGRVALELLHELGRKTPEGLARATVAAKRFAPDYPWT